MQQTSERVMERGDDHAHMLSQRRAIPRPDRSWVADLAQQARSRSTFFVHIPLKRMPVTGDGRV